MCKDMKFECDGKDADEVTVSQRTEMAGRLRGAQARDSSRLLEGKARSLSVLVCVI